MYGWWQCDSEARQRLGSNLGESGPFKQEKKSWSESRIKILETQKKLKNLKICR